MLKGKKILIGITGSIASYKSILLVKLLVKSGAEVKVILTPAAASFVSPLVLATLSKNKVISQMAEDNEWSNYVQLGRWADLFIIAPLSYNTLAKMANGFCDNILLAVYLSATCNVLVAPVMDEDMWQHPSTQQNIAKLISFGDKVIPVEIGELASGLFGARRMAEPEAILQFITEHYFREEILNGKAAIVTAGSSYEAIDPVRFIGNRSSGEMGYAIAESLYMKWAEVTLISVQSAKEMHEAINPILAKMDINIVSFIIQENNG